MQLHPSEAEPLLPTSTASIGKSGLLLSRDLIFTTKIIGTAAELGYSIMLAGNSLQAKSMIEKNPPALVLVDLTAGDLVSPAALRAYQEIAGPDVWFVAFGPHVDTVALAAAKTAGCHVVLPRSRFAADLPRLLHRHFNQPATHDE